MKHAVIMERLLRESRFLVHTASFPSGIQAQLVPDGNRLALALKRPSQH